ncbi:hypothetical protein LTV02_18260 [Nocardia yamanashiensis]|uniref:hypothetical protein n=1 Tax=Nocardia yamanashiensis TaxID=209247 RepID=UPI001E62EF98|nr:hypothetical protein [Nocardia yamanashiensis]UGT45210.1 hypothetical protein LTV02_18260 [Nocardia yamanashiensis]
MLLQYFRRPGIDEMNRVVDALELPEAVFKTCPWQPRELVETGLRQWLRCCGAAMREGRVIGMPSHAVDEAWHGLILCTLRYQRFCEAAYGRFLHHFPDGESLGGAGDPMAAQLGRTVVAWSMVARPEERCVLWSLDSVVGVTDPWGLPTDRIQLIESQLRSDG